MSIESDYLREIEKNFTILTETLEKAKHWQKLAGGTIAQEQQAKKQALETRYSEQKKTVAQTFDAHYQQLTGKLAELEANYRLAEVDWTHPLWQNYTSPGTSEISRLVRFGRLTSRSMHGQIEFPALLPVIGGRNVLIKARGDGKQLARNVLQVVTLRLLGAMPAGKLRLICIDPVGLGSTVAGFIKGLPDFLTGGQAAFDQHAIEQNLVDLENHMAFVRQKYLGVSFASMEEYNSKAGQVEEPYRLLIISDFPARFSDTSAQRLISIATNGPQTGVYLLAMVDADQPKLPYGFNLSDLERTATLIHIDGSQATWVDPDYRNAQITLDSTPQIQQFEKILKNIREAALASTDVRVPYADFAPQKEDWWQGDSRSGVRVAVGMFGARETQYFALDEKLLSSALIVGKTGSGKSTLLHVLINGLAMAYSPDEIELYLLDFKQVEFKDYAIHQLPHARVVAVKSEREFGLSVLRGLDAELQRRKDLFANMTSLSEYRTKTGEKMPRILMIADEFQELFSYDDSLRNEAELILDRLVRQGRAFGVNILLASQTLAGPNTLPNATKNQIPVRVALQSSDADSRLVLSDENDRARLLERPGEAIFNSANGRLEGNNRFQVAWISDQERQQWLKSYRLLCESNPAYFAKAPIIFDGDALANIEGNAQFIDLLNASQWPPVKRGFAAQAWLGEPVDIKPHTAAIFRRQSRSNLLILGQRKHEADAASLLFSAVLSLAVQQSPEHARFAILNLTDVDAPWYNLPAQIAQAFPHEIRVFRRRDLPDALDAVYAEMKTRLEGEESRWPALYFVISALHKANDLRREEGLSSSFSFGSYGEPETPPEKSSPEKFIEIVKEGPDVGIHTLMWCDTHANLSRVLERRDLGEFEMRAALPMGSDDSHHFIETEAAMHLAEHRALLYDEEHSGRLEKFRPYQLLRPEQVEEWGRQLKSRVGG